MRKYRKIISVTALVIILAVILSPLSVNAQSDSPRLIDDAGVLTESERTELLAKLNEISTRQSFDVVAVTTNSMNLNNPRLYAADFYESHGFGFGAELDGIILMINFEPERMFAVVTTGYGEYAFTNAGMIFLEDLFLPSLRNDRYFDAFMAYASGVDDFVTRARAGDRFETNNIPLTPEQRLNARIVAGVASIVVGLIVAGAVVAYWTSQLKSVRKRDTACDYVRQGSFALTVQRDIFLYRNIRKVAREENNGGGKGGGSFRSSSGGSFSGRSGRF